MQVRHGRVLCARVNDSARGLEEPRGLEPLSEIPGVRRFCRDDGWAGRAYVQPHASALISASAVRCTR